MIRKILPLLFAISLTNTGTLFAQFQYKLLATDASAGDRFGASVALSGDYALIGHSNTRIGLSPPYVFKRENQVWNEQAQLTVSSRHPTFGSPVSLSGVYGMSGSPLDTDNGSFSGAAYAFKRDGSNWVELGKLTASDGSNSDIFGSSISVSGDYAFIGAPGSDTDKGESSGAVYVFKREGDNWVEQVKLTASDGEGGAGFGAYLSIDGDYAVIGSLSGLLRSAYVFKRDGNAWIEQDKLVPADSASASVFLASPVSIHGDYALVGAPILFESQGPASAYIFKREGENWIEQAKLISSESEVFDGFGSSVALNGELAFIGVPDGSDRGAVAVFKREGSNWVEQPMLVAPDRRRNANFGISISVSGNYVLVGASGDEQEGNLAGAAYVFDLSGLQGVSIEEAVPASSFTLMQNYPNPFSSVTTVPYTLEGTENVKLEIFDTFGRRVATLVDNRQPQGDYEVSFDGSGLSSGVYFYRLTTGNTILTKVLTLVR